MECQLRVGDVVRVSFVTIGSSVGEASSNREEDWRYTNDTKLPFRL